MVEDFTLEQNYPNPFNSETQISYTFSRPSEVELTIFNIQGQIVKTLVSEVQVAGLKFITWNGTDNNNVQV